VRLFLVALFALLAVGCARAHRVDRLPPGDGPLVAIYKAAIDDGSGVMRRAKLSIWAARPDRLHAELIAPVGGVSFILDAGGGKACLIDVGAATAYAGGDSVSAIEALVGLRVSVADAVGALLTGAAPIGLTVTRDASAEGELPAMIRIEDGSRSIALTRVRFERGTGDAAALGTGTPPGQLAVHPIDELSAAGRER